MVKWKDMGLESSDPSLNSGYVAYQLCDFGQVI